MRGTFADSAFAILVTELATHGSVTYADLMRRHGSRFDRVNFASAVYKARKMGLVLGESGKGRPIVAAGKCPCCGRILNGR